MNGPNVTGGCGPVAERLPELALGILSGAERAEVLDHLDRCASCREASADWASTVDALPMLLAEAEPPAGFEARALELLRADQARVPRRSVMQRVLAVAAVVAVAMVMTLAAVRIIDARSSDEPRTQVTSAQMVGHTGKRAGDVFMTVGTERYVFLDVDYGVKTGMYRIEMLDSANRLTRLGNVAITGGHGTWAGELKASATGGAPGAPAMVRLVDASGEVLCSAHFGAVAA
ncbi:MAG: anti-sigma factor family protein [Acidimicrobiia bacterium]